MNLLPMIIEVVGGLIFEIQVWQYTVCTLIFIWKFNVSPPPTPPTLHHCSLFDVKPFSTLGDFWDVL